MDLADFLWFIFSMPDDSGQNAKRIEKYSKKFFVTYYGVDAETLAKWIQIFCPEFYDEYKRKRNFSNEEADIIFSTLGSFPSELEHLTNRSNMTKLLFSHNSWKKSRRYQELALDLEERIPGMRLNKLPPKIIFEILAEEIEGNDFDPSIRNEWQEVRIFNVLKSIADTKHVSEKDKAIRKRWMSIFLNSTNEKDTTEDFKPRNKKISEEEWKAFLRKRKERLSLRRKNRIYRTDFE